MVVPKHVWGALIGAGVSTISGIIQNNKARTQQRQAEHEATRRLFQQRALGDAIEFDEYNDEGYENASYYLAKGGIIGKKNCICLLNVINYKCYSDKG